MNLQVHKIDDKISINVNGRTVSCNGFDNGWYATLVPLQSLDEPVLMVYDDKGNMRVAYEQVAAVEPTKKIVVVGDIITSVQKFKFSFIDHTKIKSMALEEECAYYGGFEYEHTTINTNDFILRFNSPNGSSIMTHEGWRHYAANEVSEFIITNKTCEMEYGE